MLFWMIGLLWSLVVGFERRENNLSGGFELKISDCLFINLKK